MGNDGLSCEQVGSQANRRVTRRLAWIQPVCMSINWVPAMKGLRSFVMFMKPLSLKVGHIHVCIVQNAMFILHMSHKILFDYLLGDHSSMLTFLPKITTYLCVAILQLLSVPVGSLSRFTGPHNCWMFSGTVACS